MNEKELLQELANAILAYQRGDYSRDIIVMMMKVAIQKMEEQK